MADLYSTLPPKAYSIADFNRKASQIYRLSKTNGGAAPTDEQILASEHLINFVLTGRNDADNHQAIIDVTLDAEVQDRLYLTRDYDSLIGICEEIRVQRAVNIFPVSNPRHSLTTSIHLTHKVRIRGVSVLLTFTYI